MSTETIQRSDLEPLLAAHTGNAAFEEALARVAGADDLLRLLGRYIQFNSTFGGSVANLAGELAVRQDLFRDPEEAIDAAADRSVEVAADIFFAAVDEFDDRATRHRDTHRTLAQATLKAAAGFYGRDATALNRLLSPTEAMRRAHRQVGDGYGVNQRLDEERLFRAIGFHLGSEILADGEFRALDGTLRSRYPDLVEALERTGVRFGGLRHRAYFWIRIHTSVEVDHFNSAVQGANRALRYYAGRENPATVKGWILEGFRDFARVQAKFMGEIGAA